MLSVVKSHLLFECHLSFSIIASNYRPQRSWGKVIFYRPQRSCEGYVFTSVCLSAGGSASVHAGISPRSKHPPHDQVAPNAGIPWEQALPHKRRHPPPPGAGTPLPSRRLLLRMVRILLECILVSEACVKNSVHRGGWCLGRHSSPGAVHAGRYGQQAGGMYPTGMHTCFLSVLYSV